VSREHDPLQYRIEPLADEHNRTAFSCGVEALDRYLHRQGGQDVSKHVAAAFVITPDGETVAGFYTLSAHVLNLGDLPDNVAKKLPRYPNVPATLLGRLADSTDFRGRGISELLLLDAFRRVLANTQEVGSAVLVVDAKDERAREFYLRHDFIRLPSQPNRFFYTVKTIEKLFEPKQRRKGGVTSAGISVLRALRIGLRRVTKKGPRYLSISGLGNFCEHALDKMSIGLPKSYISEIVGAARVTKRARRFARALSVAPSS